MCFNDYGIIDLARVKNKARKKEEEQIVINLFWFTVALFTIPLIYGYLKTKGYL